MTSFKYKYLFFFLILGVPIVESKGKISLSKAYALSMENDAQFIESVGALFNGVANLQRTLVQNLKWNSQNSEMLKIKKAIEFFQRSKEHLDFANSNSDRLLKELPPERKKAFSRKLKAFRENIADLGKRLGVIIETLKSQKLPAKDYLHQTIHLALSGIGFGIEASKSEADPAK